MEFVGNKARIYSNNLKFTIAHKGRDGLFEISPHKGKNEKNLVGRANITKVELWHNRLGHIGSKKMERVLEDEDFETLKMNQQYITRTQG